MTDLKYLVLILLVVNFFSCAPKVVVGPKGSEPIHTVALLPVQHSGRIAREKMAIIRAALNSELKSAGFIVLESSLVDQVCGDGKCPNRSVFFEKYLADAVVELELDTVSRNSFLAGYYNTIAGKVRFLSKEDQEYFRVEHQESERGGLLFNSGQVFQGLISQIENADDSSFLNLANKFSRTLVSKAPKVQGTGAIKDVLAVNIQNVEIKPARNNSDEICVRATPASMVSLLLNRRAANLRELSPGHYCGIYRLEDSELPTKGITVEARSAYGSSDRRIVSAELSTDCALEGRVKLINTGNKPKLVFTCAEIDGLKPHSESTCEGSTQKCSVSRFYVYRAHSPTGPYHKIAEVKGTSWIDHSFQAKTPGIYSVVSIGRNGTVSLPVLLDLNPNSNS